MPRLHLLDHHIFYETAGQGPPLVLLHHATASLTDWRRQRPALVEAGYRVVVYDRHGFGQADALADWPPDYHRDGVAELIALLDALGLARVALVGHSDGSTISLMAAALHPDRIAAVVAEAPHMWVEPGWLEQGFETFRTTIMQQERFWRATRRDHGDQAEAVVARWRRRWLDPIFRDWDESACLPDVRCPVFVVHGGQDLFFPISHSREIAEAVPQSEFWLLDEAGHTPHLEASAAFNARLLDFLSRHYPPDHPAHPTEPLSHMDGKTHG